MRKFFPCIFILFIFIKPCFSQKFHGRFKADIKTITDHYHGRLLIKVTDSSLTILEPVRRGFFRVQTIEKDFKSTDIKSVRIYRRSGPVLGAVAGYVVLGLGGGIAGGLIADNKRGNLSNVFNVLAGFSIGSSVGGVGGIYAGKSMATKVRIKNVQETNFAEIRKKVEPFVAEKY